MILGLGFAACFYSALLVIMVVMTLAMHSVLPVEFLPLSYVGAVLSDYRVRISLKCNYINRGVHKDHSLSVCVCVRVRARVRVRDVVPSYYVLAYMRRYFLLAQCD